MSTAKKVNKVDRTQENKTADLFLYISDLEIKFFQISAEMDLKQRWKTYRKYCSDISDLVKKIPEDERPQDSDLAVAIDNVYKAQRMVKSDAEAGKFLDREPLIDTGQKIEDNYIINQLKQIEALLQIMGSDYKKQSLVRNKLLRDVGFKWQDGKKVRRVEKDHPEISRLWQLYRQTALKETIKVVDYLVGKKKRTEVEEQRLAKLQKLDEEGRDVVQRLEFNLAEQIALRGDFLSTK